MNGAHRDSADEETTKSQRSQRENDRRLSSKKTSSASPYPRKSTVTKSKEPESEEDEEDEMPVDEKSEEEIESKEEEREEIEEQSYMDEEVEDEIEEPKKKQKRGRSSMTPLPSTEGKRKSFGRIIAVKRSASTEKMISDDEDELDKPRHMKKGKSRDRVATRKASSDSLAPEDAISSRLSSQSTITDHLEDFGEKLSRPPRKKSKKIEDSSSLSGAPHSTSPRTSDSVSRSLSSPSHHLGTPPHARSYRNILSPATSSSTQSPSNAQNRNHNTQSSQNQAAQASPKPSLWSNLPKLIPTFLRQSPSSRLHRDSSSEPNVDNARYYADQDQHNTGETRNGIFGDSIGSPKVKTSSSSAPHSVGSPGQQFGFEESPENEPESENSRNFEIPGSTYESEASMYGVDQDHQAYIQHEQSKDPYARNQGFGGAQNMIGSHLDPVVRQRLYSPTPFQQIALQHQQQAFASPSSDHVDGMRSASAGFFRTPPMPSRPQNFIPPASPTAFLASPQAPASVEWVNRANANLRSPQAPIRMNQHSPHVMQANAMRPSPTTIHGGTLPQPEMRKNLAHGIHSPPQNRRRPNNSPPRQGYSQAYADVNSATQHPTRVSLWSEIKRALRNFLFALVVCFLVAMIAWLFSGDVLQKIFQGDAERLRSECSSRLKETLRVTAGAYECGHIPLASITKKELNNYALTNCVFDKQPDTPAVFAKLEQDPEITYMPGRDAGSYYYNGNYPIRPWGCAIRHWLWLFMQAYGIHFFGISSVLALVAYFTFKIKQNRADKILAHQIARDIFRRLEHEHHQQEGKSAAIIDHLEGDYSNTRAEKRVWPRVVGLVESNARVITVPRDFGGAQVSAWAWSK